MHFLSLSIAGLCGVWLRAGISYWGWPYWSTAIVNILGCFLMGVLINSSQRWLVEYRFIIAVGFLGGLTTFSGFVFDLYKFSQNQQWSQMAIYFFVTHLLSVAFLLGGIALGERV